jgi:hypothetical protein
MEAAWGKAAWAAGPVAVSTVGLPCRGADGWRDRWSANGRVVRGLNPGAAAPAKAVGAAWAGPAAGADAIAKRGRLPEIPLGCVQWEPLPEAVGTAVMS